MLGFTGFYKGKRISVQAAGMGLPSNAIYANELIDEYGIKVLIRIGTCGGIRDDVKLKDTILALGANTDSSLNRIRFNGMDYAPTADFQLLSTVYKKAAEISMDVKVGGIFSTDAFYDDNNERYKIWAEHGVLGVEMESTILYTLAARANVKALSILTVSDHLLTRKSESPDQQKEQVKEITNLALESLV